MGTYQRGGGIDISSSTVKLEIVVLENNRAGEVVSTLCSSLENAPWLLTASLQGGAVYVSYSTLDLVGCTFFSGNSAARRGDDIHNYHGTVNIDGCPAGSSGAAGAALDTSNDGGTITGERKSYSCAACVRWGVFGDPSASSSRKMRPQCLIFHAETLLTPAEHNNITKHHQPTQRTTTTHNTAASSKS